MTESISRQRAWKETGTRKGEGSSAGLLTPSRVSSTCFSPVQSNKEVSSGADPAALGFQPREEHWCADKKCAADTLTGWGRSGQCRSTGRVVNSIIKFAYASGWSPVTQHQTLTCCSSIARTWFSHCSVLCVSGSPSSLERNVLLRPVPHHQQHCLPPAHR